VSGFSPLSLSFTQTHPGLAKLGSGLRGTLRGYLYARNEQLARGFVAYADGVLLHRPTSSDRLCITKTYFDVAHVVIYFLLKFDQKLHILVEMRHFILLLSKKKKFSRKKVFQCMYMYIVLFCIFWWGRVCRPLLYLYRPCVIFEGCLGSNPESCRRKQASYQPSHLSPYYVHFLP
jgi:hypothetical protein